MLEKSSPNFSKLQVKSPVVDKAPVLKWPAISLGNFFETLCSEIPLRINSTFCASP